MASVVRASNPSMDANQARQVATGDLYAGEDLTAVAPCYIKQSDGKVYMSDGAAATEAATVHGFTARATGEGEPVTLFGFGTRFKFSSAMAPGDRFYLAASTNYVDPGNLDTSTSTGDAVGIAIAVSPTDIVVLVPQ